MRISANLLIIGFLLISSKSLSQENFDFIHVDSLSYNLYLENNWKELIKFSKKANKNNIDYYYLRLRSGIAYYETGNFIRAKNEFRKALQFNDLDEAPLNYLFYSTSYSGNTDQAKFIYKRFNRKPEKLQEAETKNTSMISLTSALILNKNNDPVQNLLPEAGFSTDGYQNVTKSILFNSLTLKHDVSPSLFMTHSFGLLKKQDYYINSNLGAIAVSPPVKADQYQYFLSFKFIPVSDLFLTAGFHYLNFSSDDIDYEELVSGTKYSIPIDNINNYVGDFSIFKSFWLLNAGAGFSYGTLNNKLFQQNYTLTFYPLGNLKLYLTSQLNLINEKQKNGLADKNILLRNTLGIKVLKNLWFESTLWNGEFKNAALNEGGLILNGNDNTTSKLNMNLIVPLKNISLAFFVSKTNYYSSFTTSSGIVSGTNNSNFNYLSYLISIKWNI